ncbi:MAG: RNA methyltransferase [Bacteroidales bacterium]|nr:RNA methyltransferase [Bacteroidales bacterium]
MKKLSMEELGRVTPEEFKKQHKTPVVLVLDNIRSMHNVGSAFRTCDAFNVERLYLCGITATPPQKEIAKTALGATESVDWKYVEHVDELAKNLKSEGYAIVLVEQTDTSVMLQDMDFAQYEKIALFVGNEVFGISDELLPLCDVAVEIPQFGTKHSLNVAVATGIVLWEATESVRRPNTPCR